ncbi:MAG: PHP domain-containing protein [Verrucomicrobiota bacterium]|nr:PHP domain-containing protein [Verrucomicrobiota bacterium]
MFTDLHLHTNFSDGTYTPEELTSEAKRFGLVAVALTDHDTVEGCQRMAAACDTAAIEFIPATELTAEFNGTELHLIGYFLDVAHPRLLEAMSQFQEVRQNRIREIVARLRKMNIPIEEDAVFALANCKSPGRPHIARALIQARVCSSLDEAFERFLKRNKPAWVPKFKISAPEAIQLIHESGGLAVLAHPVLNRCDHLIPALKEAGLDGLECYHTKHTPSTSEFYLAMAETLDLVVTGGSDCHGMNKGKPLIGSIKLPYEHVQQLKNLLPANHFAHRSRNQKN